MNKPYYIAIPRNYLGEPVGNKGMKQYDIYDIRNFQYKVKSVPVIKNLTFKDAEIECDKLNIQAHQDQNYAMYI